MSELAPSSVGAPLDESAASGQVSAGAMLRRAREEAGLHIAALAVSLKVPVKKIEALESDRIDLLPDAVFARALASSVCRSLKIDAKPILNALPSTSALPLGSGSEFRKATFRDAGQSGQKPFVPQLSRPLMWVGLVLVLAAVFMMAAPIVEQFILKDEQIAANSGAAGAAVGVAKKADLPTVAAMTVSTAPVLAATLPASAPLTVSSTAPSATPNGDPINPAVGLIASTDAQVSEPGAASVLTLKARASSWVEVVDSKGVTQSRKTMGEGESLSFAGALPLRVTVGRANSIDVFVRGQALSLTALTKDNIARFEVK